jgi:hypothetical protein
MNPVLYTLLNAILSILLAFSGFKLITQIQKFVFSLLCLVDEKFTPQHPEKTRVD